LTGGGPVAGEGGGMPMMPPMGGGGQREPGSGERPDASGLLGGVQVPWSGAEDPSIAGEVGSADGVAAGGVGLTGSVPQGSPIEGERETVKEKEEEKDRREAARPPGPAPNVVPVLGQPTGGEDHTSWEVGASAASALLGLSGLLRTPGPDDREIDARIVSSETDAWIDEEPPIAPSGDASAMATWRRTAGTAPVTVIRDPDLRSGRFPPGYVPPAPPEHEDESAEGDEEETEEEVGTVAAKHLTQDSSTWGTRADDLSALE
jgi:hypothetical protein